MKFLCPECKAKYRIADDKVAQRASSRMKCRKCGHVIDIHAARVPESVFPPAGGPDPEDTEAPRESTELPHVAAPPRRGPAPAPTPSPAPPKRGAAPPAKRSPTAGSPPRRGGATAAARLEDPTMILGDEPSVPDAAPAPSPARKSAGRAANEFEEEQPTRVHDSAALAAAFAAGLGSGPSAAPQGAPQDDWYIGIEGTPLGPIGTAVIKDKAREGKATLESLVWRDGFEEWKPLRDFPELVALVEDARRAAATLAQPSVVVAPAAFQVAEQPVAGPAAAPEKAPAHPSEPPEAVLAKAGVPPKKSVSHPVAWAAIIVAAGFGATLSSVFMSKPAPKEVVRYVEVPASPPSAAAPAEPAPSAAVVEEATVAAGGPVKRNPGAPRPEATATPASTAKSGLGLDQFGGPGPLGPAKPADTGSGSAGGGGQLEAAAIQRTVANFTPSVRRGCWDTALAARTSDAPSAARVGVTITIAPSGAVEGVSTTGDPKGYPSLSRCIESKVRSWRFPASSGTTTANVPFVFAAQ